MYIQWLWQAQADETDLSVGLLDLAECDRVQVLHWINRDGQPAVVSLKRGEVDTYVSPRFCCRPLQMGSLVAAGHSSALKDRSPRSQIRPSDDS